MFVLLLRDHSFNTKLERVREPMLEGQTSPAFILPAYLSELPCHDLHAERLQIVSYDAYSVSMDPGNG